MSRTTSTGKRVAAALLWSEVVDPKSIPLGDGKLATAPTAGSLYACRTTFDGQGAHADGPWIDEAAKTWDATTKIQVTGGNTWPQARYGETVEGGARVLRTNDLPTEQVTGDFPIAADDPAYQYDRNANGIAAKTVEVRLPLNPTSSTPSCVDQGPIGVLKNGVLLFNALDATGKDAAAHETQDVCDGHPERSSSYHYHGVPSCLLAAVPRPGSRSTTTARPWSTRSRSAATGGRRSAHRTSPPGGRAPP